MGVARKPFVLPQEDSKFYSRFLKTFNIPEFAETDFSSSPGQMRKAAQKFSNSTGVVRQIILGK